MKKKFSFNYRPVMAGIKKFLASSRLRHSLGLPLVYVGVALMAVTYLSGLSNHNWLMLLCLLMIIGGVAGYVWNEKCNEKG
jgi:hypothetical protein